MISSTPNTNHHHTADWPDRETFCREKRVIVTGGAGFLGTYVVDTLRERGAAWIQPAREMFGFTATTDFREGLRETIEWYKSALRAGQPEAADVPA